jgi:rhodanese-related sulfurtransferase
LTSRRVRVAFPTFFLACCSDTVSQVRQIMIPYFKKVFFVAFGLILLTFVSFGQVKSGAYRVMLNGFLSHSVPEIGVQEAARDSSSVVFLDAREPREFAVSHIAGAIPVGYDHFSLENLPASLPKNTPIIVYCSVGYRSEKVTEKLQKAGFKNVSNLYGGIFEWVNQDFPVVNQSGPTQNVHAFDRTWGVWLKKGKKIYK